MQSPYKKLSIVAKSNDACYLVGSSGIWKDDYVDEKNLHVLDVPP